MKQNIHVEIKITMALAQLGSGNFLQMCGEVYDIAENIASITVKEFCSIIKKHLKPLVIPKLTKNKIK
jgi:hypothetical protein